MRSNTGTSTAGAVRPGGGAGAEGLARLVDCVRAADRAMAEAVDLVGQLAGSGVCEEVEGLPLERFTGLAARMTHADARFLVTAGQALASMPATATLFRDGQLGWGQVRAIVAAVRGLSRAGRQAVDTRVEATAAQDKPGVGAFDPDGLVWAVEAAVEELTPVETERAQRRRADGNFLSRQLDLDGGMTLYGGFDPLAAAAINTTIDAAMGRLPARAGHDPHAEPDPDADDAEAAGHRSAPRRWSSTPVAKAAAGALVDVCADWLGGDAGAGGDERAPKRRRRARPLLVAHVDLSQVSTSPTGTVELSLRGPLPRIGAATLERLANDADLKAVLFDGRRPLAVSRQVRLQEPSAKTRFATRARDRACRFPGSLDPVAWTDIDHIHEREHGGDHHPDNLVCLSRRPHVWRHRHGWTITLHPHTGMVTVSRGTRRFHSLPRGTGLAPPPDDPRPADHPPDRPPDRPPDPSLPF